MNVAQPQATEWHKSKHMHSYMRNTGKSNLQCTTHSYRICKFGWMKRSSYTRSIWILCTGPAHHVLYTKCRLSRHGQMKALSLSSPSLLTMALKGSVHMMSDLNAGTMSQAKLQITASTDETTCNSPSIKEVEWQKELGYSIRANTNYLQNNGRTIHIYTRIKNIKNVTRCRDSRSAKSIETR